MTAYESLEPKLFFHYFAEIAKIPHPSGDLKRISDYLLNECLRLGAEAWQDETLNVVAVRPASEGFENASPVMIQGHMDMVAEKTVDSDHDFHADPIRLILDGDMLHADRTTLGSDDGTAVAMMLALIADKDLKLPRLECIFTTDEETGMDGAEGLDLSFSKATCMINLDSEDEGVFTVSCAGGATFGGRLPLKREKVSGTRYDITVKSRVGGHSGTEIHKDRPNTNVVAGQLLSDLVREEKVRFISLNGGNATNAIPMETTLSVVSDHPILIGPYEASYRAEYVTTDDNVTFLLSEGMEGVHEAVTSGSEKDLLFYLTALPNGALDFNHEIEGLTETSLNLGRMRTTDDLFTVDALIRSSVFSKQQRVVRKLTAITERANGEAVIYGCHPGWAYRKDSPLRDKAVKVWNEMYPAHPAEVVAIHAGLECGILVAKKPDLDIIAIGPSAYDIHTPKERVSVSSIGRVYAFITELLKNL